ncbi:MAG TPA: serine/threonine-protein kinase [Gemmatimonadales bacterium]|nr:serine/threonine-protein kinase [Gemmatimonadales bacterium]
MSTTRLCPSCSTPLPEQATTCYVCGSATPPAIDRRTGEIAIPEGLLPLPGASEMLVKKLKESLGAHYELGNLIGRGGFAEVFQVRDLWLKRDLALKAIRSDLVVSETILARFRREAEAVAALRHPNIVPIYDIGETEGIMYILMPLIKGESLKSLLARDGRRPINEARRILLESAGALGAAHEAGLVHRDIKPENIMLEGKARRVLIMDFGIAKVMDAAGGDSSLTSTGTIVGTPHYMSPEQASGDPHIDHRTDQYSLAVVGYHMLTGSVPFEGDSTRQVLFKQMMESPRSMRELVPEVPEALMAAVSKGMAKEPAERFPAMDGFAEAIEQTISEETRAAALAAIPKKKRSPLPWMLAGAGVLATVAIVAAILSRPPAAETPLAGAPADSAQRALAAVNPPATILPPAPPPPTPPPAPAAAPRVTGPSGSPTRPGSARGTTDQSRRNAATAAAAPPPAAVLPTCARAASGDDRDLAFRICTAEAQTGNPVSERLLAGLYDRSQVPGHDAEAVDWYRKAADAGDLPSMLRLGQLLSLGKGVAKNELDATARIKQAAEAEYQPAWVVLAERYERGLGIRRSDKDAAYWLRKAAEKGDLAAQARVGDLFMRGKGVDKDEAEAVRWLRLAAEKGNRDGQYGLGIAYLRGRGIARFDSAGYVWLGRAAEQGHAEAQREVARRKP